ncbi:WG repeat-containing protein [Chryseobacterium sp. sg2396]|uniref:WG repeat-containing protein n=1 Tax=Chryseobacterium sp. sg2396 TaxID=3276280 RepID=UPI00367137CE
MKNYIILLILFGSLLTAQDLQEELLIPYRDNNLWGFCDSLGNIKVKPFASEIRDIKYNVFTSKSRFVIKEENSNYYVIDNLQKALIPKNNRYDSLQIRKFDQDEIYIYKNGKMGLYKNNKELIPCIYNDISAESNKSFIVKRDGYYGLINSSGKQIIPLEYKYITFSEKNNNSNSNFIWKASKEGMYMNCKMDEFFDTKIKADKESSPGEAGGMQDSSERIRVSNETVSKVEQYLADKYDSFRIDKNNNLIFVEKGIFKGVLSLVDGKEIVKLNFDEVDLFMANGENSIFKVNKAGTYGLVCLKRIVVPVNYEKINRTFEELNILINNHQQGFFDEDSLKYVDAKYKKILNKTRINTGFNKSFNIYKILLDNGKEAYVGENGVEYFK